MVVVGRLFANRLNQFNDLADITRRHRFQQFDYLLLRRHAKHLGYALGKNTAFAVRNCLVSECQRIAHTSRGSHGYLPEGIAFGLHVFFNQDLTYVFSYTRGSKVF
jgi:hypothetical protein